MSKTDKIIALYDKYVMKTYTRVPLCIDKAKGTMVWDIDGGKYLDFFPGWAVSGIGHCHPTVVATVSAQARKLLHVSNNYYAEPQALLAKTIIEHAFPGKVFFANSGAEANEAAIKLARKHGSANGRYEIITTLKSFHGRTLAMITATGQDKVKNGFAPLPRGFVHVPFNDLAAVRRAVNAKTAAIMIEPIQCEGGVNIATRDYLQGLRALCDEKKILLIFDEVQTGMGRSGQMFAFKNFGITPDVMTLAKALGGGLPIGACVARDKYQDVLTPGTHASTFGGSPIVCAGALGVFTAIRKEKLLENARKMGEYLKKNLLDMKKKCACIKEIRSVGLIVGMELTTDGDDVYRECLKRGLLLNSTQGKVLRLMPPLTVTTEEIDKALAILEEVLSTR